MPFRRKNRRLATINKLVKKSSLHDWIPAKIPEKVLHPWEQKIGEAEHLVKYLTYEGQKVLDPLLGTGTTAVASLKLNRRFIGIEKVPDTLVGARAKIAHWLKKSEN